ncbi:MAG TPA: hypothetical protein VF605_14950 [Allosphingosinicella sp.]|jgi:hypothetical protein
MTSEADRDLPLHDEAKARSKWRGGETIIEKGGGDSGPASEIDNAAQGGDDGPAEKGLAQRPPD